MAKRPSLTQADLVGKFQINEKHISSFEGEDIIEKIVFEDSSAKLTLTAYLLLMVLPSSINFALKMGIVNSRSIHRL